MTQWRKKRKSHLKLSRRPKTTGSVHMKWASSVVTGLVCFTGLAGSAHALFSLKIVIVLYERAGWATCRDLGSSYAIGISASRPNRLFVFNNEILLQRFIHQLTWNTSFNTNPHDQMWTFSLPNSVARQLLRAVHRHGVVIILTVVFWRLLWPFKHKILKYFQI